MVLWIHNGNSEERGDKRKALLEAIEESSFPPDELESGGKRGRVGEEDPGLSTSKNGGEGTPS